MTLTLGTSPLGTNRPTERNYEIEGPKHLLLMTPFPRRVRAAFAGETVFDTTDGRLVHESNLLPVLYVPEADVRDDLLVETDHTTHCPFKGDAAYHSIQVGDRVAENAVWSYPNPVDAASWLRGHHAFYWDRLDAWFDEDERVEGHLRDPYHRVDVRRSSRHVRVVARDGVLAETNRPMVLSETGLPNRWYLPADDVDLAALTSSTTTSVCPYKGEATYWHLGSDADTVRDLAFTYQQPFDGVSPIAGMVCFMPSETVVLEVDGEVVAA